MSIKCVHRIVHITLISRRDNIILFIRICEKCTSHLDQRVIRLTYNLQNLTGYEIILFFYNNKNNIVIIISTEMG